MEPESKIKVLLVADHPFVLEGLRVFLQQQASVQVVGEATDGAEAINQALALRPDVIVMDIAMPRGSRLDAIRELGRAAPESKVLILTTHEKREAAFRAIQAGAHGYLAKSSSPSELMRAIGVVHRGETFFEDQLRLAFPKEYVDTGGKLSEVSDSPRLTVREREVVVLIAKGLSNKEAANALGISVRTVEKRRERIMKKLELQSAVDLIRYAKRKA